jgi:hypothetical protein
MGKKGPNLNLATRAAVIFMKSPFGGSLSAANIVKILETAITDYLIRKSGNRFKGLLCDITLIIYRVRANLRFWD